MLCSIDIETRSRIDLIKAGVYRYAEDDSTDLLCICYQFDDGPVHLWAPVEFAIDTTRVDGERHFSATAPADLVEHMANGGACRAHNAQFERVVLNAVGHRYGVPKTEIEQWTCTAAKAAYHAVLRDLKGAAEALGTHKKDMAGRGTMLQLSKPRKPTKTLSDEWFTPENAEDKFGHLYDYCADDVRAEHGIDLTLQDLPSDEQRVFWLDQKVNDRGVMIDVESVRNVVALMEEHIANLQEQCRALTGGIDANQTGALAEWVRNQGYDIADLQSATLVAALKDDLPAKVRRALEIRATVAMKAPTKYKAMLNAVCADQKIRGMWLYYGAATGRYSSKIVQLQNLHRGFIKDPEVAVEAYRWRDLCWLRSLYDIDPMKVFASTVRSMLIADPGHDLLALDFSQIEARVLPWLAGEEDVLEVFRSGQDIYSHAAARTFKVPVDKVSKDQRFVGKVIVLSCGYQGAAGAYARMAKNYGVEVPEEEALENVRAWREGNQKIVQMWYEFEREAKRSILKPGAVFPVARGKVALKTATKRGQSFLLMRLPSGRVLHFFRPKVNEEGKIEYTGIDTFTRRWGRTTTYGGSLVQSAVQAIARDLMVNGMLQLEEAGYPVVGTVHDEVWMQMPEGEGSLNEAAAIMCTTPGWADGLPVKASGFRGKRYRKE